MTRTKGRVVLSKNPKEILDTSQKIYEKHLSLGAASPLKLLEGVDWAVTGPKLVPTSKANDQAAFHKGEMEKQFLIRDVAMPDISKILKQSISLLKSSFGDNPKKLADWGVQVDDSPKVKTTKVPKPKA